MADVSILNKLRQQLALAGVDALLIPRGDAFNGEEVPPADERLAHASGFTGSAGLGIVRNEDAMLFSDGRYTLQMESQKASGWDCATMPEVMPEDWLLTHHRNNSLGFDPMLMPLAAFRRMEKKLKTGGITLVPLDHNPVDAIWPDRPAPPVRPAFDFDEAVAGLTRQEKITAMIDAMGDDSETETPRAMLISDPAVLCWLLNIRGRDLDHTPFVLAFAVLSAEGMVTVYGDDERFAGVSQSGLVVQPAAMLMNDLAALKGVVLVDPTSCPVALHKVIKARVIEAENPAVLMKARKTPNERAAFIATHQTDAVAMIRFLHWFDQTLEKRPVRETEIDAALINFRSDAADFLCPSFATICGGGGNGAIVHYRALPGQDQVIPKDSLCLIDSGGQYRQATTDITRTVATGTPPAAMAQAFTHVLKAHIALATSRFPAGTTGVQLDALTRAPLWQAGMEFNHGTGHGVGCCLSVHEGPASISKRGMRVIVPGMILSNEPGFYVEGEYGIRIENLVHVAKDETTNMLMLETISLAPIDQRLIIAALMTDAEIDWLNAYHHRIGDEIGPMIRARGDADLTAWLEAAIAPISR